MSRTSVSCIDTIIGKEFPVLDKGFVKVIDYMGDDTAIVNAARISYGGVATDPIKDRGLIRFLLRHRHTSPFEMCEMKFHIKMPLFIARQWIRHRTAHINEYSARYSITKKDQYYIPNVDSIMVQSIGNLQARGEEKVDAPMAIDALEAIERCSLSSYQAYQKMVDDNVAKEIARVVIPLNYYTEIYWKIDLHNLMHFLKLRSAPGAQFEIREYAKVILGIIEKWVPVSYEAFIDYNMEATFLSKQEIKFVQSLIDKQKITQDFIKESGLSQRELNSLMENLGIVQEAT